MSHHPLSNSQQALPYNNKNNNMFPYQQELLRMQQQRQQQALLAAQYQRMHYQQQLVQLQMAGLLPPRGGSTGNTNPIRSISGVHLLRNQQQQQQLGAQAVVATTNNSNKTIVQEQHTHAIIRAKHDPPGTNTSTTVSNHHQCKKRNHNDVDDNGESFTDDDDDSTSDYSETAASTNKSHRRPNKQLCRNKTSTVKQGTAKHNIIASANPRPQKYQQAMDLKLLTDNPHLSSLAKKKEVALYKACCDCQVTYIPPLNFRVESDQERTRRQSHLQKRVATLSGKVKPNQTKSLACNNKQSNSSHEGSSDKENNGSHQTAIVRSKGKVGEEAQQKPPLTIVNDPNRINNARMQSIASKTRGEIGTTKSNNPRFAVIQALLSTTVSKRDKKSIVKAHQDWKTAQLATTKAQQAVAVAQGQRQATKCRASWEMCARQQATTHEYYHEVVKVAFLEETNAAPSRRLRSDSQSF